MFRPRGTIDSRAKIAELRKTSGPLSNSLKVIATNPCITFLRPAVPRLIKILSKGIESLTYKL